MANTAWSNTDKTASVTLTGSNLIATSSASAQAVRSVDRNIAGKFFWETTCNVFANTSSGIGIANGSAILATVGPTPLNALILYRSGSIWSNNANTGITLGAIANGTVIGQALDLDNKLFWMRVGAAGNWNGNASNNPVTRVGGISITSFASLASVFACCALNASAEQFTANFGDSAFTGAAPSGFTAGFTAGANPPWNAMTTQDAVEQWADGVPVAQTTQTSIEHWASVITEPLHALVTQMSIEQWSRVTPDIPPPPPRRRQQNVI